MQLPPAEPSLVENFWIGNASSEDTYLEGRSPSIDNAFEQSHQDLAYAQEWLIFHNVILEPYFDLSIF